MELKVNKPNSVIILNLIEAFFIALVLSFISAFPALFLASVTVFPVLFIIPIIVFLSYLIFSVFNSQKYSQTTSLKLNDNSIDITSSTVFNQICISLPLAQIENIQVYQSLIHKMLKISKIYFFQESGTATTIDGIDHNEASEFAREVGNKYKVKIRT